MNTRIDTHVDDNSCPTGFIVLPALIGGLVWLCVILSRIYVVQ
jgi:hypothetical protein